MRAYITSRGRTGVSFGIIGTVLYLFAMMFYYLLVGIVIVVVGTFTLCREGYRWYQHRNLPPDPWA